MITRGQITSISGNIAIVHIPLFDSVNDFSSTVEAVITTIPGIYNTYKQGDMVFVGFENNCIDDALILGKLYVDPESEATRNKGGINADTLVISGKASLPKNTTFGDLSIEALNNLASKVELLPNSILAKTQPITQFSTNELQIGTWIDGNNLYRKVIETTKTTINISDITDISYKAIWIDTANSMQITDKGIRNSYYKDSNNYWNAYIDKENKQIKINAVGPETETLTKYIITVCYSGTKK